jgi:hypothetical protein
MCQVRQVGGLSAVGEFVQFDETTASILPCPTDKSGVTHKNGNAVSQQSFKWKAPNTTGLGELNALCTIVVVRATYWVKVASSRATEMNTTEVPTASTLTSSSTIAQATATIPSKQQTTSPTVSDTTQPMTTTRVPTAATTSQTTATTPAKQQATRPTEKVTSNGSETTQATTTRPSSENATATVRTTNKVSSRGPSIFAVSTMKQPTVHLCTICQVT